MSGLADFGIPEHGDWLEEARLCRANCALFDFSFMSRARLKGDGARQVLERVQSRPLSGMAAGEIRYGLCLDSHGAVRSDITVWCNGPTEFDIYSGSSSDIERARRLSPAEVVTEDLTESTRVYAIQGPGALKAIAKLTNVSKLCELRFFRHCEIAISGVTCQVGRLGYTGERGFEIIPRDPAEAARLYAALSEQVKPAGLMAADMLRIEAGYLLFSSDCRLGCGPAALGLAMFDGAPQHNAQYKRVFFHSAVSPFIQPFGAPETMEPPAPGTIAVTSASPSVTLGGCIGMGLIRANDPAHSFRASAFTGDSALVARSRPFFDPGKLVARGNWRS